MRFFAFAMLCIFIIVAQPVSAATPTPVPTATLQPIAPTPTYNPTIYLRNTPTPFPAFTNIYSLNLSGLDLGGWADTSINIWRYYNKDHLLDFIGMGLIAILAVAWMVVYVKSAPPSDSGG